MLHVNCRSPVYRFDVHYSTGAAANRMERYFFQMFSTQIAFFTFTNNNLGHSIKAFVGFSVGSIREIINKAKHQRNTILSDCYCCQKTLPSLQLHFMPQDHAEVQYVQTCYLNIAYERCLHIFYHH